LLEESKMSSAQKQKIESNIELAVNIISYYELTEKLLAQYKQIAPELYNEIDIIKDKKGRPVNVHIKFVPVNGTALKSWGTTLIDHAVNDADLYVSEYGEHSVSVKIWAVPKAFLVLSHELGHVKYQVPNLAEYVDFYKKQYPRQIGEYESAGHRADDLSGRNASEYAKRYVQYCSKYYKTTNEKPLVPLAILNKIKQNVKDGQNRVGTGEATMARM
jgi:hypothetical protein